MLKLYDYFRSSACYRVRIALNLKELDYEAIPIHLVNNGGEQYSPSYHAVNPQQLVPSLNNDGKILTQSLAIIEYLNETHPAPPLLPTDPLQKSRVRAFAYTIACEMHPLNNLRVHQYLINTFRISEEQKNHWYHHWLANGFNALEQSLLNNTKHDFCFGDMPSMADICLVPQMFNARRFKFDLESYPNLRRIDENCRKLTAFMNAEPMEKAI